jgi:hypothetical protein
LLAVADLFAAMLADAKAAATAAAFWVRVSKEPLSLDALTQRVRDPRAGAFPGDEPAAHDPIGHLEVVANADAYLIAPASANTIAKLAHGLADNLLTSAALANVAPLVVAPAMNSRMYEHPATQANLEQLRSAGVEPFDFEEADMSDDLWLGEGFTNYFDSLVQVRAMIYDRIEYDALNRVYRQYVPHGPPARTVWSVSGPAVSLLYVSVYLTGRPARTCVGADAWSEMSA